MKELKSWYRVLLVPLPFIVGAVQAQTIRIPDKLTLETARILLLQNNPALQAARIEMDVQEGDVIEAKRYTNPALEFGSEGLRFDGVGSFLNNQEISFVVRQKFLTRGKRAKQRRVEQVEVEMASMGVKDTARLLLFDLKQAYYEVVLAQGDLKLGRKILDKFQNAVRLNRARFELGEISGAELRRIEAAEYSFLEDVINAEVKLENARDKLASLLGTKDFIQKFVAVDSFDSEFVPPALPELNEIALQERDDLAMARAGAVRANALIELEQALAAPNVTVFSGFKRDFGRSGAIVGINIPLFVFNRNEGPIARARAEHRRQGQRLRLLEVEALKEVQLALNQLHGNRRRIEALRGKYLQIARESRDITGSAYRLGAAALTELLEAERTHSATALRYNEALYEFQISKALLELAVGRDLGAALGK